jgi:hypothetical protein
VPSGALRPPARRHSSTPTAGLTRISSNTLRACVRGGRRRPWRGSRRARGLLPARRAERGRRGRRGR